MDAFVFSGGPKTIKRLSRFLKCRKWEVIFQSYVLFYNSVTIIAYYSPIFDGVNIEVA